MAEHRAVLVRGQGSLPVGGLDALCRLIGGAAYDPREHGAELLLPERSRSYLVTNVADAATGRLREGRERRGKGRRAHLPIEGFGGGVLGDAA